ncbi:MAG TPA: ABC transporter substrate-binding protein [Bradyrhizobium sp.]|nr:ABC transporter substrate-binding protein [Bradyrhizobium sp.]
MKRTVHVRVNLLNVVTIAGLLFGPSLACAEDGVTNDAVVFGQAAVFEGPAAALGTGMRTGIQAAFDEANKQGGIHGRKLKLDTIDDGYEPEKLIVATKKLIDEDKVFALIGPVGTPTSAATQPIATAAGVPFIGAFTGASFLRDPKLTNVINVRASYDAETEAWAKHLVEDLKVKKIAIFYQDDSFGRAGLSGFKQAMEKRGMEIAAEGTFERNTVAVKSALLAIKRADPEAVVMVSPYKPAAEFIKLAHKIDFNPVFVNISFVGAVALAKELGPDGSGVVISQVVPFPWDASIKVVADYQAAIKALDPQAQPDFVSLEGYIAGRLVINAIDKVGDNLTREALLQTIRNGTFDIGGLKISYGSDRAGLDTVFMTVIQGDGSFKAVDRLVKVSRN